MTDGDMFAWKKEYELGIDQIDDQHRKLIDLGNRIGHLLQNRVPEDDNYDLIMSLLDELRQYTIYHFEHEEDLFERAGYPDAAIHKYEHDGFVSWLDNINVDSIEKNQEEFLKQLLKKLINWLFKHILTSDKKYKQYLSGAKTI